MTSKHVELAFEKARELVNSAKFDLQPEMQSHTLLESVFNALVTCDDDAELAEKSKGATA